MLVERKPDVIYSGVQEIYLGASNSGVSDVDLAMTFATRQEAEAYRRTLKHRYHWVAVTAPK
ncbi:hypothetical protein HYPDE_32343 [Hyphomicrobium denitrificans 1NES1]|uniref:Uncharacterized protein n=2 Tax=Hyphomicrobium denitrificans TaxID=53399 RepID=N0B7B4_9HYPH|nr:hypothetical protein HYPDE_32343 [Hyphomicrobium denitrificans 1NES1]